LGDKLNSKEPALHWAVQTGAHINNDVCISGLCPRESTPLLPKVQVVDTEKNTEYKILIIYGTPIRDKTINQK